MNRGISEVRPGWFPRTIPTMDALDDLLEQSNQTGIDFLLTELDTALTFLSVAKTTRDRETATRNRRHAHTAYESVLRYQGRVHFDEMVSTLFETKLALVKQGLQAVGFAE